MGKEWYLKGFYYIMPIYELEALGNDQGLTSQYHCMFKIYIPYIKFGWGY